MSIDNIDSIETLELHKKIIRDTKFLYSLYKDFYQELKRATLPIPIVEIGSGAGFIKKVIPKTITSDVVKSDGIDIVASAEKLPFKKASVGSIVMLNVFHHIKNPVKALKEFDRCLKSKGKIVMIEPCNTLWSRFIYQTFHSKHERFDPTTRWRIDAHG